MSLRHRVRILFGNKYKRFGLSRKQVKSFQSSPETKFLDIDFKNQPLKISNPFWFLHSVDEVFIDNTYKFKTNKKNPLIIDCGANWGLSIIYFKEMYPDSTIFAFEPDPTIFKILTSNIESRHLKNVQLINKAVWNKDENLEFASDNALGGSIATLGINQKNQSTVEAVRLKDFLLKYEEIDFLKIDIEGAEYEVVKDCKDDLLHVKHLFIEYHSIPSNPQYLDEILGFVRQAGFRFYIKEAWNVMGHPFIDSKNVYYDVQLNIFCYRN